MENLIALRKVNKFYGSGDSRLQVVKEVSFEIADGEFVAIVGASGSGKSTLLNILGCLDRPTDGNYILNGKETADMDDDQLSAIRGDEIGFVFQSFQLIPQLTILENVEVPLFYSKVTREERAAKSKKFLERVGLGHRLEHLPSQLSGGEQQRAAIARALVNDPSILLADEPTGNLDSKSGANVMRLLWDLHEEGRTVIMVTHNPEIAVTCPRQIEIRDGRILKDQRNTKRDYKAFLAEMEATPNA